MVRITQIPGIRTGQWYRTADGRELRIIDVDTDGDAVEIEYRDGEIEELDIDSLYEAGIRPISARRAVNEDLRYDYDSAYESGDEGYGHTLYEVLDSFEH